MRRLLGLPIALGIGIALSTPILVSNALHVPERVQPDTDTAAAFARDTGSAWQDVQIKATDGLTLDAWLFTPPLPSSSLVLLLHGVGDTRAGMLGHAQFLLAHGFTVLAPDSRGHGASGGDLITFGIREAADVHRWADWAFQKQPVRRLYGIGESMGAAILLQSLPEEPRFRAVVAECPFASFEEISCDRLHQITALPRATLWPIVNLGFLYGRIRYGVDLRKASPADALRHTSIPALLIHGTADTNIPFRHSQELHAANPGATRLWVVEGGQHVAGMSANPEAYARTVVDWFDSHP